MVQLTSGKSQFFSLHFGLFQGHTQKELLLPFTHRTHLMSSEHHVWGARDRTQVSHEQGKCTTQCTITRLTPALLTTSYSLMFHHLFTSFFTVTLQVSFYSSNIKAARPCPSLRFLICQEYFSAGLERQYNRQGSCLAHRHKGSIPSIPHGPLCSQFLSTQPGLTPEHNQVLHHHPCPQKEYSFLCS